MGKLSLPLTYHPRFPCWRTTFSGCIYLSSRKASPRWEQLHMRQIISNGEGLTGSRLDAGVCGDDAGSLIAIFKLMY